MRNLPQKSKHETVDWNSNLTYVRAEFVSEKMNDGVFFAQRARFTAMLVLSVLVDGALL